MNLTLQSLGPPFCCRATKWTGQNGENKENTLFFSRTVAAKTTDKGRSGWESQISPLTAEQTYLGEAIEGSNIDTGTLALPSECVGSNPRPPLKS